MFKKKPAPIPLAIDSWVLAQHNEHTSHHGSYDEQVECHAGQVKLHDGGDFYAVRFHFGTRWVQRKHLEPVTRDRAEFVYRDIWILDAQDSPTRLIRAREDS